MTINPVGSFTEYDITRRMANPYSARLTSDQASQAGSDVLEADRLASKRAELSLARARRYDPSTGRTDIYL